MTYIRGDIDNDDELMRLFFDSATIAVRGDVLGHIGWSFMHADTVVPDILNRAAELWDWRARIAEDNPATVDELNGFFWYVKCGKFSVDWWVPRLRHATALSPSVGARAMIHEQLAEASTHHPGPVLDIVRRLTADADEQHNDQYMLIEHAVPQVVAAALDNPDAEICAEATALMHELGERGYIDLDAQISALRQL